MKEEWKEAYEQGKSDAIKDIYKMVLMKKGFSDVDAMLLMKDRDRYMQLSGRHIEADQIKSLIHRYKRYGSFDQKDVKDFKIAHVVDVTRMREKGIKSTDEKLLREEGCLNDVKVPACSDCEECRLILNGERCPE